MRALQCDERRRLDELGGHEHERLRVDHLPAEHVDVCGQPHVWGSVVGVAPAGAEHPPGGSKRPDFEPNLDPQIHQNASKLNAKMASHLEFIWIDF